MSSDTQGIFTHLFANVPDYWEILSLPDVVDFQEGPGILAKDFHDTGVPLLRLSSISGPVTTFEGCNYLDPAKVKKKWDHFRLKEKDILLSTSGSLGRVSEVAAQQEDSVCYTGIIRFRPRSERIIYSFIKYFLQSEQFKLQADSSASGSVLSHFGPTHLKKMSFPVPPLDYQKFIEGLLSPIDDKIQFNQQINQTLEQMAQAIFISWFVDFEPVKAKIAALKAGGSETDALHAAMHAISGKDAAALAHLQTEHPEQFNELHTTAELFPSAMQDSELGEIPAGWICLALDEIAKYQNGLALQKFRPENENDYLPVVKIAQLKKGNADGAEKASPKIKPECIIDNGDVVFSWSGSLMVDTWCGGKAALNQHLFKVTSNKYPKWLYFQFTRHHLNEFQRIAADKAVTMGHIKREHLQQAKCAVPDKYLIESVGHSLQSMLEKQIELRLEVTTLSKLRDALLPKLLSGELTVNIADSQLAEATNN